MIRTGNLCIRCDLRLRVKCALSARKMRNKIDAIGYFVLRSIWHCILIDFLSQEWEDVGKLTCPKSCIDHTSDVMCVPTTTTTTRRYSEWPRFPRQIQKAKRITVKEEWNITKSPSRTFPWISSKQLRSSISLGHTEYYFQLLNGSSCRCVM